MFRPGGRGGHRLPVRRDAHAPLETWECGWRRSRSRTCATSGTSRLGLGPGLNVFAGRNAQGKTSLLEAVALLSRGRSFRTDEVRSLIRTGASGLRARGLARHEGHVAALEVELSAQGRRLRVDGREVPPRATRGGWRWSSTRRSGCKVIRGPMRERRQYIDRGAAALWPAYRQALRDYERVVQQRNALLEAGGSGLEAWDERLVALGSTLRHRRGAYVARLGSGLERALHPEGETYVVALDPAPSPEGEAGEQRRLTEELAAAPATSGARGAPWWGPIATRWPSGGRGRGGGGGLLGSGAQPAPGARPGHPERVPRRAGAGRRGLARRSRLGVRRGTYRSPLPRGGEFAGRLS